MWYSLGKFILRFRLPLLIALAIFTAVMLWNAKKIELSYEFGKAIPSNNIKYKEYLAFKNKFGDDGNTVVLGVQSENYFTPAIFSALEVLQNNLKIKPGAVAYADCAY